MAGLRIDENKCVGCSLCIKSCPCDALNLKRKLAYVNDKCTLCGFCIDSCPFGAIEMRIENHKPTDISAYKDIWVYVEYQHGRVLDVSFELINKARELADIKKVNVCVALIGNKVSSEAQKLIAYGADQVYLCENTKLEKYDDEDHTVIMTKLIQEHRPDMLLIGATGVGRSLAPRIAARVKTGLTADCTVLEIDLETGLLMQTRPAFGGNIMATIVCPNHRPQMASVRQGVLPVGQPNYERLGDIIHVDYQNEDKSRIKIIEEMLIPEVETVADTEIVIAVGRGIGEQKNMEYAEKLAKLLGGKVGVSRPLVDLGWSDYKSQIGQTGVSISPKLLIAFGISGAVQHLSGIKGAERIVAVNTDSEAPIFQVAHYKVVGDCVEIMKALINTIKSERTNK